MADALRDLLDDASERVEEARHGERESGESGESGGGGMQPTSESAWATVLVMKCRQPPLETGAMTSPTPRAILKPLGFCALFVALRTMSCSPGQTTSSKVSATFLSNTRAPPTREC